MSGQSSGSLLKWRKRNLLSPLERSHSPQVSPSCSAGLGPVLPLVGLQHPDQALCSLAGTSSHPSSPCQLTRTEAGCPEPPLCTQAPSLSGCCRMRSGDVHGDKHFCYPPLLW